MLQALLLGLSGLQSSALQIEGFSWSRESEGRLSLPESELLNRISRLGSLRSEVRRRAENVSSQHPSFICRAVSSAVLSVHLTRFHEKVIAIERDILQSTSSMTSAYSIVPISGLLAFLQEWFQLLTWLKHLMLFIQVGDGEIAGNFEGRRSGSQLIDWLRQAGNTGHPNIEAVVHSLSRVADSTWLRIVSTWLLYGHVPKQENLDFFIRRANDDDIQGHQAYTICQELAPTYVTNGTARSIVFIGKSISRAQEQMAHTEEIIRKSNINAFVREHLNTLASINCPITPSGLSRAIGSIRSSLASNVQEILLPSSTVLRIFEVFQDFMLLQHDSFANALVRSADKCLNARGAKVDLTSPQEPSTVHLRGIMIRESELSAILAQTWSTLTASQGSQPFETDDGFELARSLLEITIKKPASGEDKNIPDARENEAKICRDFDDVLLGIPTALMIKLQSPMDLILTSRETAEYSAMCSYLLSTRRAFIRINDMWKLPALRRLNTRQHSSATCRSMTTEARTRFLRLDKRLRPIWATLSSARLFLSEFLSYLQDLIANSWAGLRSWLLFRHTLDDKNVSRPSSRDTRTTTVVDAQDQQAGSNTLAHDPEAIASSHKQYLDAIVRQSLLSDHIYSKALRALISCIDHLTALIKRLERVLQANEIQASGTMPTLAASYSDHEEVQLLDNLAKARQNVQACLKGLIYQLEIIDIESRRSPRAPRDMTNMFNDSFEPPRGQGIDSLLLRLNIGSLDQDFGALAT